MLLPKSDTPIRQSHRHCAALHSGFCSTFTKAGMKQPGMTATGMKHSGESLTAPAGTLPSAQCSQSPCVSLGTVRLFPN